MKASNANMIMHLAMNDEVKAKVVEELKQKVFKDQIEAGKVPIDIRETLTYDRIIDLSYLSMVFSETIRLEPPVIFSGVMKVTQETEIGGITIQPSDNFIVSFQQLHHDPDQWGSNHDLFIPERFDPTSSHYLTPSGTRRHPLAFSPFFGGKRICIGKTFAEVIAKIVVPGLLARLDFEFADPAQKTMQKPILNVDMIEQPKIMMIVKQANYA